MVNTVIYFFPFKDQTLSPEKTLATLKKWGIKMKSRYSLLWPDTDANGHLVRDTHGRTVNEFRILDEYEELVGMGYDLRISNEFLMISYAIGDPNPNISLSWSRRWFSGFGPKEKKWYMDLLLEIAHVSNSSYVLFLEDLFDMYEDRFEDRFIWADEVRLLDDSPKKRSNWDFAIDQIWIRDEAKLIAKSGRKLDFVKILGNGFSKYELL